MVISITTFIFISVREQLKMYLLVEHEMQKEYGIFSKRPKWSCIYLKYITHKIQIS